MQGSWESSPQCPTLMVPPPGIGSCAIPPNVACDEPCTLPIAKPIRIFQFLLVAGLFSLTIFTVTKNSPYEQVEGILLSVLFGSFLFIELIDIISQFGGDPIPDTPMFLFGVVGTLLFLMAVGGIFFVTRRDDIVDVWRLTVSMTLAAACSLLFFLDVLLIFLYGRSNLVLHETVSSMTIRILHSILWNQQNLSEPVVPERIRSTTSYEPIGRKSKPNIVRSRGSCPKSCAVPLCRPLRIFQFLTTLVLFSLVIYLTVKSGGTNSTVGPSENARLAAPPETPPKPGPQGTDPGSLKREKKSPTAKNIIHLRASKPGQHLTHLASILLIILTSFYLFIMAIDIISQFGNSGLPDSPMFLFTFLGVVFFGIAGALMVYYRHSADVLPELILSQVLCFVISALFLIELTMLLAWWRVKCLSTKKCYPYTPESQTRVRTLFQRDCPCDIATSTSRVKIPLDTGVNSAVEDHGYRKISTGHRREYVDRPSSVPALSSIQIAEIQTESELHCVTECQTQRTEMRESTMQTSSRCELCNRIMNPPSQYSTQPQAQASQYQFPQQGHCAMCPAFFSMMRGGMAGPCCQSCNCGETTRDQVRQPVPYLVNETPQRQQTESDAPRIQQESQHQLPKTSTTASAVTKNNSPTSTSSEKFDAELRGSNKLVDEGTRYRPSKKIPRVHDTCPCPTHVSDLAAKMAEFPETMTKVSSSSTSLQRNRRIQTPGKTSTVSQSKGDTEKNESTERAVSSEEKCQSVTFARRSNASISDSNSGIIQDVNKKIISDEELRKRLSEDPRITYAPPAKSILHSQSLAKTPDLSTKMDKQVEDHGSVTSIAKSGGKILYRAERSDPRISEPAVRDLSRLRDKSSSEWDVEKSSAGFTSDVSDESEVVVKTEALTPLESELSAIEEENTDSESSTAIKQESRILYPEESRNRYAPVLRLRLDESSVDFESSTQRVGGSEESDRRSNSKSGSTSKELLSKTRSTTPSRTKVRTNEFNDGSKRLRKSGKSGQIIRSPASKASSASRQRSGNTVKDSHSDFSDEDRQLSKNEGSMRPTEVEDKREEFSERDESEPQDLSADEAEVFSATDPGLRSKSGVSGIINNSPGLRLRPEKSGKDLEDSQPRVNEPDDMISRSGSKNRSTFKGLLSKTASTVPPRSTIRNDEMSEGPMKTELSGTGRQITGSPVSKSEPSGKIEKGRSDPYTDPYEDENLSETRTTRPEESDHETFPRSSTFVERSENDSSQVTDEELAETIIQEGSGAESEDFESSAKQSSARPTVREKSSSKFSRSELVSSREDSKGPSLRASDNYLEILGSESKTKSISKRGLNKRDSEISSGSKTSRDEVSAISSSSDGDNDGDDSETAVEKWSGADSKVSSTSPDLSSAKRSLHDNLNNRTASRFKFEKHSDGSKVSILPLAESGDVIRSSRPKNRSSSTEQSSMKISGLSSSSKTIKNETSKESAEKRRGGKSSRAIPSSISKASDVSLERSVDLEKDLPVPHSDSSHGQRKFSVREISSRIGQSGAKSDYDSTERDVEDDNEEIENSSAVESEIFASSPGLSRTEPSENENIASSAASRTQSKRDSEQTKRDSEQSNNSERRISTDDATQRRRSKNVSSGSEKRKDETSRSSLGKRSKEGSEILRSPQKVDSAIPKSYSDLPDGQRTLSDRRSSGRLREVRRRGEGETHEKDEKIHSDGKVESLGAESKISGSSSKSSGSRKNMDGKVDQIEAGDEENVDAPRRATEAISTERHSVPSSSEFIYVRAPWSSDGSVLQRKRRAVSVEQQTPAVSSSAKLHGPSTDDPPSPQ